MILTLKYERLEKYCSHCFRLNHEKKECPYLENQRPQRSNNPPSDRNEDKDHRGDRSRVVSKGYRDSEGDFSRRLDRHGRPFGDRVSEQNQSGDRHYRQSIGFVGSEMLRPPQLARPPLSQLDKSIGHSNRSISQFRTPQNLQVTMNSTSGFNHFRTPVQEIWREKVKTTSRLPDEEVSSRRARRIPLERNLDMEDFPLPEKVPSLEEVMEELNDATLRYCSGPDPVENAARRQRILNEPPNLIQETAISIIKTAEKNASKWIAVNNPEVTQSSDKSVTGENNVRDVLEKDPPAGLANQELLLMKADHPQFDTTVQQEMGPGPLNQSLKNRGRASSSRLHGPNSFALQGAGSKKRLLHALQSTPKRKQRTPHPQAIGDCSKQLSTGAPNLLRIDRTRKTPSTTRISEEGQSINSLPERNPPNQLILPPALPPKQTRGRKIKDFHVPPSPPP